MVNTPEKIECSLMLITVMVDLTVISKKRGEHELVALCAMMMAAYRVYME